MRAITSAILADKEFEEARATLLSQRKAAKPLPLMVNGLSDGAKEAFLAELLRAYTEETASASLVLVSEEGEAASLAAFLQNEGLSAVYFPPKDFVLLNISASRDTERERLAVLDRLQRGEAVTVVTTPSAALAYTMPPERLAALSVRLAVGEEYSPDALARVLTEMGFVRVETVEAAGQFAKRGGILDVFSSLSSRPVRVEFFGDEVDRLGYFDPISQRMEEACATLTVLPAMETLPDAAAKAQMREAHAALLAKMEAEAPPLSEKKKGKKQKEEVLSEQALLAAAKREALLSLRNECAALENGLDPLFKDRYISLVYKTPATLLTYFKERSAALVLSDSGMKERYLAQSALLAEGATDLVEKGFLPKANNRFFAPYAELETALSTYATAYLTGIGHTYTGKASGIFGFRSRRTVSYFEKPLLLKEDVRLLAEGKTRVLILTENETEAENLSAFLQENGITALLLPANEPISLSLLDGKKDAFGTVGIVVGEYPSGFELLSPRIAVLSTLIDEAARRRLQRKSKRYGKRPAGQKILSYADLSVGDYVVHTVHGIGVFEGMEQITSEGVTRDYITLRYAGTDKLFLPADRLEMIAKYIGAKSEDGTVKLSRLGGTEWQRSKSRAKASAAAMAKELVALYAARQRRPGYAFPEDSDMERDFAADFIYEETEPQLLAISEILADMKRPVPMDRLLCGDVGFGKTEVALRAAFKAIVAGKQVAILVPTTILAMQHYQTALSRMRGYPVNVEMLSRLRSQKEQKAILRRLSRGEVDLIIGTHALLSKNVAFKDLGLLIVDEEQRFGVGQKERLKSMAENVDVLTLSATPIPRTLNMAMSGIRDMSILDEAPADRHPVQTYVLEHDDFIIEEAVRRELSRGGQVLYLYNRVGSMERPLAKLSGAFPEARIAIAHGQMDKEELEDIWQALVRGELDILVCTTIVETGIDLPTANTLVIEDADRMGLSQLHQLRGRVGRSERHAYAYFTYRRGKELTEIAEKRLKAIKEYAEFGAGFKIALRDLEIRGAGNLLGAEQHGHIDSVGYDLYIKILNEAILEERGEKAPEVFEAQIELLADANIPMHYIEASSQRMEMYKKISYIRNGEDMQDVLDELCDRFGDPPRAVLRLLEIAAARALASRARIAKIEKREGVLRFIANPPDLAVWSLLFASRPSLRFSASAGAPVVAYRLGKGEDAAHMAFVLMQEYAKAAEEAAAQENSENAE